MLHRMSWRRGPVQEVVPRRARPPRRPCPAPWWPRSGSRGSPRPGRGPGRPAAGRRSRAGELAAGRPALVAQPPRRPRRDHGVHRPGQRAARPAGPAVRVHDLARVHGQGLPHGLVRRRPGPLVWQSGPVRGHRQRPAGPLDDRDQHRAHRLGPVADRADRRLAGRLLPAAAGRALRRPALRAADRALRRHGGQGRAQERGRDLAGLQHLGRLRPVPRARAGTATARWRSAWTGRTTRRAPSCSWSTSGS